MLLHVPVEARVAGAGVAVLALVYAIRALYRTLVTLPALALAPIASRRLAARLRWRHYSEDDLLRADDAPRFWVDRRREGLECLAGRLNAQYAKSAGWGNALR